MSQFPNPRVFSGLEVLRAQDFAPLRGLRIGLVTHAAAVDSNYRHVTDILAAAPGVTLAALFGPEHGLDAAAQDLERVGARMHPRLRIPIHSLYSDTFASLRPTPEMLRALDALVIDLQDIGSRYYTFQATMLFCMEAAFEHGLLTVVLDRPNPLGGDVIEGPTIQPGYESFVGIHPLPIRHGLTIGELARLYKAERGLRGKLQVIPCEGWQRAMHFDETGLPWVMPSPNMPTLDTAFVYPGQCLLEGTNQSEGRGTTRPFELCGAPLIHGFALAQQLNSEHLPGIIFRPAFFRPTFQKHAGKDCGGAQLHVTNRHAFQPVRTSLALLAALRKQSASTFDWRREPYEFVTDRLAIDLLFGSDHERRAIESGVLWREIANTWEAEEAAFRQRRRDFLLYS